MRLSHVLFPQLHNGAEMGQQHQRAKSSEAKMTPPWREDYSFVIALQRCECAA